MIESLPTASFWKGKRVLMTGHTGFKGSWLTLWLSSLGAKLTGLALPPPTTPSMFELAQVQKHIDSKIGDIRDYNVVLEALKAAKPEIVIHMAAQPLVRCSYDNPLETFDTNVMGTAHVLEAARTVSSVRTILIITTDKCYENREWVWGYREGEALGGHDPYSASKGCAEIVTAAFRNSFFKTDSCSVASARAGNVIGGGDWAQDRLIPDMVRAVEAGKTVPIRNPRAVRPWQHVLEPLSGYLVLCEKMYNSGKDFAEAWNFGPNSDDEQTVQKVVEEFSKLWGSGFRWEIEGTPGPHEANLLRLDCTKAKVKLRWKPQWDLKRALSETVNWYRTYLSDRKRLPQISMQQIESFGAQ